MGAIDSRFARLRAQGEKALVLYVTAGDPTLEALPEILRALEDAGADLLEVGIPFSDPIADGPVIQAASQRALERSTTPQAVLEALVKACVEVPIVLMGYYNTMLRRGLASAALEARQAGVDGFIVCDLIPEEAGDWVSAARSAGLDTVFLAAPTSTDERVEMVCRHSTGFVYAVSRTGVTGASEQVPAEAFHLVDRIQARTTTPVCVGFGVSKPEHVRAVCSRADGAVVGSWLVDRLAQDWSTAEGRKALLDEVRSLKAATRG